MIRSGALDAHVHAVDNRIRLQFQLHLCMYAHICTCTYCYLHTHIIVTRSLHNPTHMLTRTYSHTIAYIHLRVLTCAYMCLIRPCIHVTHLHAYILLMGMRGAGPTRWACMHACMHACSTTHCARAGPGLSQGDLTVVSHGSAEAHEDPPGNSLQQL